MANSLALKRSVMLAALLLGRHAFAQVEPFSYRLGARSVTEDAHHIVIDAPVPVHIEILPGGHTWPLLALSEDGTIHVGNSILDAQRADGPPAKGPADDRTLALSHGYRVTALQNAFRISRGTRSCTFSPRQLGLAGEKHSLDALKHGNLVVRASERKLLALTTWVGADNSETRYAIVDIDLARCRTRRTNLGNPDLLVELGWSPAGGWWVTGSIEQTLLQSQDGKRWRPVMLPKDLSSLVSAYIVDARHIWLAGIVQPHGDDDPLIAYSSDGGKHWTNITREDPVLAQLPRGWLEGWRRLGQPIE